MVDSQTRSDPEFLSELANELQIEIRRTIQRMRSVNSQTRTLALNATIEAARVGELGRGFAVVANEIKELSKTTEGVAEEMSEKVESIAESLRQISNNMAYHVRGTRLADLALQNIGLIDRNLFERTCDVRWWATDASLVDACMQGDEASTQYASTRLGVILAAYTVYYDLVLCDPQGKVIANGMPQSYPSVGKNVAGATWFQQALSSTSGDDYGFETVHASSLVEEKRVLAYSCAVRVEGKADGKVIGVLGVLFNWDDLAQVIVHETPMPQEEKPFTRMVIMAKNGLVLADTHGRQLEDVLKVPRQLEDAAKGFFESGAEEKSGKKLVAFAKAPGYEGYSTGWISLALQDKNAQ
ncbi:MAG: methyl-accepting chemotaxis protein [Zetaproteobacteria bacterium]|nr:methyl-accepting chemotaxis protein [Zetaproteobacteria bacterium]